MMLRLRRLLGPLVAIPHSTIAVGLVFLLAPSGWLMRLISPALTGLEQPPTWGLVPDPYGLVLILGLVAKELPFLLLLALIFTLILKCTRKSICCGVALSNVQHFDHLNDIRLWRVNLNNQ